MPVYALFNNDTKKILVEQLVPGDKRLDWIPVDIPDKQTIASAEKGFSAIYNLFNKGENLCVSYEIDGGGDKVVGASAGLAFALALYEEFTGQNSVLAATGILRDGTKNARVQRVEKLPEKIRSAMQVLEACESAAIVYPSENEEDIPADLREEAVNNGFSLRPVGTLAEAVDTMNRPGSEKSSAAGAPRPMEGKSIWVRTLLCFLAICGIIYIGLGFGTAFVGPGKMPAEVQPLVAKLWPWAGKVMQVEVFPQHSEDMIRNRLSRILEPYLREHNCIFQSRLRCRSRLFHERYSYEILLENPTLEFSGKMVAELHISACSGAGSSLDEARDAAVSRLAARITEKMEQLRRDHP